MRITIDGYAKPTSPGEFIVSTYLEPFAMSGRYFAERINVAVSTLNRVLKKQSGVGLKKAFGLSKAPGRSPESWLAMQDAYDLWEFRKNVKLSEIQRTDFDAA